MEDVKIGDRVRHVTHGVGHVKWVDCFGAWVQWDGYGWMSLDVLPRDLHKTGIIGGDARPSWKESSEHVSEVKHMDITKVTPA